MSFVIHRYLCPDTHPDPVCRDNYTLHYYDPPLLYDLHHDPGEIYNLDVTEYKEVINQINKVLRERSMHISAYTIDYMV